MEGKILSLRGEGELSSLTKEKDARRPEKERQKLPTLSGVENVLRCQFLFLLRPQQDLLYCVHTHFKGLPGLPFQQARIRALRLLWHQQAQPG